MSDFSVLVVEGDENNPLLLVLRFHFAQVGTILSIPLFSEITEDLRPITLYLEYCKEVSGGGWNIL